MPFESNGIEIRAGTFTMGQFLPVRNLIDGAVSARGVTMPDTVRKRERKISVAAKKNSSVVKKHKQVNNISVDEAIALIVRKQNNPVSKFQQLVPRVTFDDTRRHYGTFFSNARNMNDATKYTEFMHTFFHRDVVYTDSSGMRSEGMHSVVKAIIDRMERDAPDLVARKVSSQYQKRSNGTSVAFGVCHVTGTLLIVSESLREYSDSLLLPKSGAILDDTAPGPSRAPTSAAIMPVLPVDVASDVQTRAAEVETTPTTVESAEANEANEAGSAAIYMPLTEDGVVRRARKLYTTHYREAEVEKNLVEKFDYRKNRKHGNKKVCVAGARKAVAADARPRSSSAEVEASVVAGRGATATVRQKQSTDSESAAEDADDSLDKLDVPEAGGEGVRGIVVGSTPVDAVLRRAGGREEGRGGTGGGSSIVSTKEISLYIGALMEIDEDSKITSVTMKLVNHGSSV